MYQTLMKLANIVFNFIVLQNLKLSAGTLLEYSMSQSYRIRVCNQIS